ncbi:hypothetical protein D3C72_1358460 [compost metagenome]
MARAVAEAVHLHFDEAVVKAQVLRQAPHELRLAGAGQAPQADDDRAADELRQHVPGAQRIDHAIDDLVDAEQLGLQRMGNGLQVARALGQRGVQVAGNVWMRHEVLFSSNDSGHGNRNAAASPREMRGGRWCRRCAGQAGALQSVKREHRAFSSAKEAEAGARASSGRAGRLDPAACKDAACAADAHRKGGKEGGHGRDRNGGMR